MPAPMVRDSSSSRQGSPRPCAPEQCPQSRIRLAGGARASLSSAAASSMPGGTSASGCSKASAASSSASRDGSRSSSAAASAHSLSSVAVISWSAAAASASEAPEAWGIATTAASGQPRLFFARRTRAVQASRSAASVSAAADSSTAPGPSKNRLWPVSRRESVNGGAGDSISRTPRAHSGCRVHRGSARRATVARGSRDRPR